MKGWSNSFQGIFRGWIILTLALGCASQAQITENTLDYDSKRLAIAKSDSSQRFSSEVVLNSNEERLNQRLLALRLQMKAHYDSLGFFPPAQPFEKYKRHVEETLLFKLLRKMPKGAIHHLHTSAAADFKWLVDTIVTLPQAYVYWDVPSKNYIKGEIEFFPENKVPKGFSSAKILDSTKTNFKERLFELLTFSKEPTQDSLDVWGKFEKIFQRIDGAYTYKPLFESFVHNAAEHLIEDGIMHMESRFIFNPKYDFDTSGNRVEYPLDTTIQILKRVEKDIKKTHPEFTHKVIYTSLRFFPKERVTQELVNAFKYRKNYPELIKGFDLVAEEDNGNSTYFFKECWQMMDSLQKVYQVDMPLYLHDGESNSQAVTNLYDAILLKSKRIGHGFNLMNFPKAISMVKEKDICIEVNPLSNQILGYVKDLRLHPASLMLRHGVQCSISSDDPAIFKYKGLSYDYWYATMAWELNLRDIKKLVFNSVTYSTLDSTEKKVALTNLNKRWNAFVEEANTLLELD